MCRLGDLFNRLGSLSIAGRKAERGISRKMFTDVNLPLSGHNNILGKSLVIYDDFGPVARGERLACSMLEFSFNFGIIFYKTQFSIELAVTIGEKQWQEIGMRMAFRYHLQESLKCFSNPSTI